MTVTKTILIDYSKKLILIHSRRDKLPTVKKKKKYQKAEYEINC